jgi:hypothetical protein
VCVWLSTLTQVSEHSLRARSITLFLWLKARLQWKVQLSAQLDFPLRMSYIINDGQQVHVGCLYLATKTEETLVAAKHLVSADASLKAAPVSSAVQFEVQ